MLSMLLALAALATTASGGGSGGASLDSSSAAALVRENAALRQQVSELQRQLDGCHDEAAPSDDEGTPSSRGGGLHSPLDQPAAAPATAAPPPLPRGSYRSSCYECRAASQLVTCRCPQRGSVTAAMLSRMPPANLSGGWAIPFAAGGRSAGQPAGYFRVVAPIDSNLTHFSLVCGELPLDGAATCQTPGAESLESGWRRGAATLQGLEVTVELDSGWRGCAQLEQNRSDAPGTAALRWQNCSDPSAPLHSALTSWERRPDGGLLTSVWLPSCAEYADVTLPSAGGKLNLSNSDGHLSCEWRAMPPPRVGNLTTGGFESPDHTCRTLASYTFLAPQYMAESDPIAVFPLLNATGGGGGGGSRGGVLEGSWTSFAGDRTLGGDTFTFERVASPTITATAGQAKVASSTLLTEPPEIDADVGSASESEIERYSVVCVSGGEDPSISCNPFGLEWDGMGGNAGNWYSANVTLNTTSYEIQAAFDPGGVTFAHSYSGTVLRPTVEKEGGGSGGGGSGLLRVIEWLGGRGEWVRINPQQLDECCRRCTEHSSSSSSSNGSSMQGSSGSGSSPCRGWVVDARQNTCSLVGSVTTAYPALGTIAGYPLTVDAASYCISQFGGGGEQGGSAWADSHLAPQTTCGSMQPLPPSSTTATANTSSRGMSNQIDFPRQWTSSNSGENGRGTAWFFFPDGGNTSSHHRVLQQNLTDLWTSSTCSTPGGGYCIPNNDILQVTSDASLGTFTITCLAAGPLHHCTPSGGVPIRPNQWHTGFGTLDWVSHSVTLSLDDDIHYSGTADSNYNTIVLTNPIGGMSGLKLQRKARCSCQCADEPDCMTMTCIAPDLGPPSNAHSLHSVKNRSETAAGKSGGRHGPSSYSSSSSSGASSAFVRDHVVGKRWAVFVHGGVFRLFNPIDGNYAMLMSKLSALSVSSEGVSESEGGAGFGVLGVDYRTTDAQPLDTEGTFPTAVNDVIAAMAWLEEAGASAVTLVGDSSGGTIVVQVLLELARRKAAAPPPSPPRRGQHEQTQQEQEQTTKGKLLQPKVAGAVTLSAWLDLTDSSPSYHSHRHCNAECEGIGAQAFHQTPGAGQLKSMCDAMRYAGQNFTVADPRISPAQASAELLGVLPCPLMLIIGGNEQLLGENLEFGQRAQAAGARVQVEVFEGMWHDFVQESEGCGASGGGLVEAEDALRTAARFLNTVTADGGCAVTCKQNDDGGGGGGGATATNAQGGGVDEPSSSGGSTVVNWHYRYNYKPPATKADCRGIW
jgi:acetyl esterase/lipase